MSDEAMPEVSESPEKEVEAKAYTMALSYKIADPYKDMSLEELEKAFDLAGARITYANSQIQHWKNEQCNRMNEFDAVTAAYKQRKHGFTDEQIKGTPQISTWSYAR